MKIELINTGSELMLGRVLNTHQRWLCRRLADAGWVVARQVAVPDDGISIRDAAAEGLQRARLVITTGGLGPTSDDITRELIAEMLGLPLREDSAVRNSITEFFRVRGRSAPERVMIQAQVPEGAIVLPNAFGTAPGLAVRVPAGRYSDHSSLLVMLPGPPRELQPMFDSQVLPLIQREFPAQEAFHCLTLRTTGIGESWVEERLSPELQPLMGRGLEIGYCARIGEVDVRLVGRGHLGANLVAEAQDRVRECLSEYLYGTADETLESAVIHAATAANARIAVAESCTGGLIAHRLTNVAGSSACFWGAWVVYDNAAKMSQLGVEPAILTTDGAVSEACARAMAEGARSRAAATHVVAVTGIAGPGGGTSEKPVGTAFAAVATPQGTIVRRLHNPYDRETFKLVTSQQALDMLRRALLGLGAR